MTDSTSNVFLDGDGNLVIKAIKSSDGTWTSGRIETKRMNFRAFKGGLLAVEASIRLPNVTKENGLGYWSAFWLLGADFRGNFTNWPEVGEIDIMEHINGFDSTVSSIHCGVVNGGPCNEKTGISSGHYAAEGLKTSFHTYRMEYDRSIQPEQVRFYLDNVNFFSVKSNQIDSATWNKAFHHDGFFIILNLAIGGEFPAAFGGGPTEATVSGGELTIDYVKVFIGNVY
ncbi:MAG: family 16 glycosylhydrolase [Oligoflexia bacterium]|nr:family 16 glycosylhydrolase [Oligoflexia bacterium]